MDQEQYSQLSPLEACNYMKSQAEAAREAGTYDLVCLAGEAVFYVPHDHGLIPGHIYSELGMDEFRISRSCEYHFDEWTKEPDEEEYDGDVPQDSDPL